MQTTIPVQVGLGLNISPSVVWRKGWGMYGGAVMQSALFDPLKKISKKLLHGSLGGPI